jgi:hypothetical protein
MTKEIDQPRFRRGENASRPYGGNISDDPFSQALHKSAVARGFESQSVLANAVEIRQSTVGRWYRGESIPSPEVFGNLLILFNAKDEEREPVVEAYANRLGEREEASTSHRLKTSRRLMRPLNNPIGRWIEDFCNSKNITLRELFTTLGLSKGVASRGQLGLGALSLMLERVPKVFGLTEEETEGLSEVVVLEIQNRVQEGRKLANNPGGKIAKKVRDSLGCCTYTGSEAAAELKVSGVTVSNLRKKFNLPILLTAEHVEMLRKHLEPTKVLREKQQKTRTENRPTITSQQVLLEN